MGRDRRQCPFSFLQSIGRAHSECLRWRRHASLRLYIPLQSIQATFSSCEVVDSSIDPPSTRTIAECLCICGICVLSCATTGNVGGICLVAGIVEGKNIASPAMLIEAAACGLCLATIAARYWFVRIYSDRCCVVVIALLRQSTFAIARTDEDV